MNLDPVDVIVLLLTGGVVGGLIISLASPFILKEPLSDKRSEFIAGVVASMVAAIILYIGAKLQ